MKKNIKRINLALQGGGAHGAFTWGVLDRLLEEDDIEIAGISGTSAGALNGAALKAGLVTGGRDGAKQNLDWLWAQMGAVNEPVFAAWMAAVSPATDWLSAAIESSPAYAMLDSAARLFSPYSFGPLYHNPLQSVVEHFNFDKICASEGPAFYVCATNVRTGKIRVFAADEMSTDVILASACLPTLFQAVEFVDSRTGKKEAYWDGGYTGNPALFPLFDKTLPEDIVIININPLHRDDLPTTTDTIQNRINEISFNTSLFRELRAISFVQRLLANGNLMPGSMKNINVHMIADDELMNTLNVSTKLVPTPMLLGKLKSAGRAAAEDFLDSSKQAINVESSVNLVEMFS